MEVQLVNWWNNWCKYIRSLTLYNRTTNRLQQKTFLLLYTHEVNLGINHHLYQEVHFSIPLSWHCTSISQMAYLWFYLLILTKLQGMQQDRKGLNLESSYSNQLEQNSLSLMMIDTLTVNLKLRLENIKQGYTKNPYIAHDHSWDKGIWWIQTP